MREFGPEKVLVRGTEAGEFMLEVVKWEAVYGDCERGALVGFSVSMVSTIGILDDFCWEKVFLLLGGGLIGFFL